MILKSHLYLRNKSINQILQSQISATEKVFNEKIFHLEVLRY